MKRGINRTTWHPLSTFWVTSVKNDIKAMSHNALNIKDKK